MADRRPGRSLISWPAMAFMTIAATGSIAQLSASAEYGLGSITLYILPALLFLLPVALIAAELATGWEGGVFSWVREGMNDRLGFQAQWLQWIQSVALYPSLLSFAAASLAYAFGDPALASNGLYTGILILIIFWGATFVAMRGVNTTARIASLGMIAGTAIPAAALVAFMFIWLGDGQASNTPLAVAEVVPNVSGASGLVLIISNFIAFAGLEVNAVHVRDMRDPGRGYPKALALAGITIVTMYMLGSVAIAVMVPSASINLNAGAPQAFTVFGTTLGLPWLGQFMSGLLVLGILAATASWVAGPSRGLLNVGREGFLPPSLQKVNDVGVQRPILMVQGVVVSVLAMAFVFIPSVASAFWFLQAMTVILYLSMYIILFVSAWRLRRLRPDVKRTFRVPAIGLFATVGCFAAAAAIALAFIPPAQFGDAPVGLYIGGVLLGVVVLGLSGQVIFHFRKPEWRSGLPELPDEVEYEV